MAVNTLPWHRHPPDKRMQFVGLGYGIFLTTNTRGSSSEIKPTMIKDIPSRATSQSLLCIHWKLFLSQGALGCQKVVKGQELVTVNWKKTPKGNTPNNIPCTALIISARSGNKISVFVSMAAYCRIKYNKIIHMAITMAKNNSHLPSLDNFLDINPNSLTDLPLMEIAEVKTLLPPIYSVCSKICWDFG